MRHWLSAIAGAAAIAGMVATAFAGVPVAHHSVMVRTVMPVKTLPLRAMWLPSLLTPGKPRTIPLRRIAPAMARAPLARDPVLQSQLTNGHPITDVRADNRMRKTSGRP